MLKSDSRSPKKDRRNGGGEEGEKRDANREIGVGEKGRGKVSK